MNKFLRIAGVVFLFILSICLSLMGIAYVEANAVRGESKAYVEKTLPQILADPSTEKLFSFMLPEAKALISTATIDGLFSYIDEHFGKFLSVEKVQGNTSVTFTIGNELITAQYKVLCKFEKADTTAVVQLQKISQKWSVAGLYFDLNSSIKSKETDN